MHIKDVKRKKKVEGRVPINLKVLKSVSKWMKEKQVSPTKVFNAAIQELMDKDK